MFLTPTAFLLSSILGQEKKAFAMNLLKYGSLFCLFFTCYLHLVCAQISPTQVTVSSPSSSISESAVAAILVVAIIVTALILYALVLMILKVRGRYYPRQHRSSSRSPTVTNGLKRFTREEMALATENFGQSNLIGKGGYGKVYKGIVANHAAVAIKCAQEGSLQGEREFRTEIELLSNLHHRNLVSLIGYCDDQGQQMLVYEYMENGTLLDWLFDDFIEPLTFNQRLGIALGAARGLLYLHAENNPPIIHRDVKASNILLDSSFRPKVGDFGLSRLGPVPDNEGNVPSHVSTIPKGTPGYMDPNFFYTGELTPKSDVYSLGVVFLELLTGRNAILNHQNLVIKVNLVYQSRHQLSLIDKNMGHYPDECMRRFLVLALDCCKEQPDARPNMSEVVRELEDICSMMPESSARDLRD